MIKKQKRQIRGQDLPLRLRSHFAKNMFALFVPDLQLDIDMHMKETADLILQKEQGIAEMVSTLEVELNISPNRTEWECNLCKKDRPILQSMSWYSC